MVRSSSRPFLLEVMTYRFRGHSMGDPERYRKQEEVKKWQENDPIGMFRIYLNAENIEEAEFDAIDDMVDIEVAKAVEFAEASPDPTLEDLYADVYVD